MKMRTAIVGLGKMELLHTGILARMLRDIIMTLDADGATDPEEMHKFVEPLLRTHDFAKGSRSELGLPVNASSHRIFGNSLIAAFFNILYGSRFTDHCSGYNAFWKNALERVNLKSSDCFEDERLLIARVKRAGLRIAEVGHRDLGRIYGEGKAPSWGQGLKVIKTITTERLYG
jgi:hypothetical protein